MSKKFNYVIILAGGNGDRVKNFTYRNAFPKVLMSLGNETIFTRMMTDIDEVTISAPFISLRPEHIGVLEQVNRTTGVIGEYDFDIIPDNGDHGTAQSLYNVIEYMNNEISLDYNTSALVIWSDILEQTTESLKPFTSMIQYLEDNFCIIGTDVVPRHRYNVVNGEITHSEFNGNVAGCYAFSDIKEFGEILGIALENKKSYDKPDVIDVIKSQIKPDQIKAHSFNFIDIGDEQKYSRFMTPERVKTRFFNKIVIGDDKVTKIAVGDRGYELAMNELAYYGFTEDLNLRKDIFVTPFNVHVDEGLSVRFDMPRLSQTVQERVIKNGFNTDQKICVINRFKGFMRELHDIEEFRHMHYAFEWNEPSTQEKYRILRNEYIDVTTERFESVRLLIESTGITRLNGNPIPDFKYMMLRVDDFLQYYATHAKFGVIHGDPNTNNVMFDSNDRMWLIDPRGTFGGEKYFGDVNYDIAKFIYSIGGYADFNEDPKFKAVTNVRGDLLTKGDPVHYLNFDELLKDMYDDEDDEEMINLGIIISLIWLKLPAYIINNPTKAVYAYFYGMDRLNYFLTKWERVC